MRKNPFRALAVFALLCVSAAVFLGKGYESTIPATDTGIYADLSMSATQHGLVPRFPVASESDGGHWGPRGYNDMPFAFIYLNGWVMRALGPTAFSAKLLSGLFSIACVGLVIALGFACSPLGGLWAGLILLFTRDFIADGVNCHLDNVMLAFILGSFLLYERGKWVLAAIVAGLGMWFKSPVALLLFPSAFLFHAIRGELKSRLRCLIVGSSIAVALGISIWLVPGLLGHWELVRDYWMRQVYGTAVGGRGVAQARDWLLFFSILRTRYLVGSALLAASLAWALKVGKLKSPPFLLPLCAATVIAGVVSAMRFKYGHYFVPAFPFLALLGAQPVAAALARWEESFEKALLTVALGLSTLLLCAPIELAPESFPAVKRFSALIQSYGTCADRILFVEGFEPYGSYVDYMPELNFYTGRAVVRSECTEASARALEPAVAWVLIAGDNYPRCLGAEARARFPRVFRLGNQYLLSREIPPGDAVDLTPLERELRAPVDCMPAGLPGDRYHQY